MRHVSLPRTLRILGIAVLAFGLWVEMAHVFAHHHHANFQIDSDCAVCKVISSGVRLNDSAPVVHRAAVFTAVDAPAACPAVPLDVRFLRLRAPSTSPPA